MEDSEPNFKITPQEIAQQCIDRQVTDITHKLPVDTSQQFWDFAFSLLREGVSRMPIIGFKVKGQEEIKVYMLTTNIRNNEHRTLLDEIKKQFDSNDIEIVFTTSIEGIPSDIRPTASPFITLKDTPMGSVSYLTFGRGSDAFDIISEGLNREGKAIIKNLFSPIKGADTASFR